jgi:hypothetical protein
MFALNLDTWRADPVLRNEQERLDRLADDLDRLRTADPAAGRIVWTIRQLAVHADAADTPAEQVAVR